MLITKPTVEAIFNAVARAIKLDRLSIEKGDHNYCRNYIYIGTDRLGRDVFENLITGKCDV